MEVSPPDAGVVDAAVALADAADQPVSPVDDPQIGHVVIHAPQKGIRLTANGVAVDAETAIPLRWGKAEIVGWLNGKMKKEIVVVQAGKTLNVHIEVKTKAPSRNEPVVDDPLNNGIR